MGSGAAEVDAKIIRFIRDGAPWLIVERRDGADLICSTWNGTTHAGETRYPIEGFALRDFKIKHYYGTATLFFDGLEDYARAHYLRWPYFLIHLQRWFERAGTELYNRRRLVLHQRLDLLTFMVEQAADGKKLFNSLDLMTDMHSLRWITHPRGESVRNRVDLYLDSLVDTGELTKHQGDYVLTGRALRLVEDRAVQERMHRQSIRIQWLIVGLTFVAELLTLAQMGLIAFKPLITIS